MELQKTAIVFKNMSEPTNRMSMCTNLPEYLQMSLAIKVLGLGLGFRF